MQRWSSRAGSQVLFHNWVGTAVYVGRMAFLRCTAAQSTSSTMLAQLCWHHPPIAAVVWGSRVRHSLGRGLLPLSPKCWVNSARRYVQLGWLHFGVVGLVSFEVNVQTGGHNGSWPQSLLPSCPRMSSMTKSFHVLLARIGEEAGEGVWGDTGMFVSPLSMAWVVTSPPIQLWINCTLRKCCVRVVELEQQQKQN